MFSWFYKWSLSEIIAIIDKVDEKRKKEKIQNKVIKTSMAEDLRNIFNGNDNNKNNNNTKL